MRLDIKTYADSACLFTANDDTNYIQLFNDQPWVLAEFVCYIPYKNTNIIALKNSKRIIHYNPLTYKSNNKYYSYTLKKDGRYEYYKYAIPEHNNAIIYYDGTYHIENEIFFYNDNFYLGKKNVENESEIIENSTIIANWYNLKNYFTQETDFVFGTEFFTICNLQQCLVKLQKEIIFNGCDFTCIEKNKIRKAQRDFIFASVFVIDYLLSIKNYNEAQRILEHIWNCGNTICDNNLINNCNCK